MDIFVYGTLREGMYNYDRFLKGHVTAKKNAYIKGSLHSIIGKVYPALLEGEDFILGEVLSLDNEVSMADVDELEGYLGPDCIDNEYNKLDMEILDEDKKTVIGNLPVYMYNVKNPQLKETVGPKIQCNDFVLYDQNRSQ